MTLFPYTTLFRSYIIFFSQLFNLLATLASHSAPDVRWQVLALMAAGGVGGGMMGRALNRRMDSGAVERLFMALMAGIICVSVFNAWRYAGG